jgi:hypothetical protein
VLVLRLKGLSAALRLRRRCRRTSRGTRLDSESLRTSLGCMKHSGNADRLADVETAVEQLTEEEYDEFRRWFLQRDWEVWDRQIEADAASGKLDFLVREARDAKASGKLRKL